MKKSNFVLLLTIFLLVETCVYAQLNLSNSKFEPVYANAVPVCSPESLSGIKIPNTIIKSVITDPAGDYCQVTAIVNHPPATDSVKIWIRLPIRNWNGRFYGTGG